MEQDVYGGCLLCPLYPLLSIRDVIFQEEQICIHRLNTGFAFCVIGGRINLATLEPYWSFGTSRKAGWFSFDHYKIIAIGKKKTI